jgi:hemerythrin superfamily protein
MPDDDRDVIEILTHDHREVEGMFGKLTAVTDPGERRQIADQITIELVRHSVAEEEYLYPAVREHVPDGDAIADKELSDHAEVEHLLKGLEKADPDSDDFAALTGQLIRTVNAHVKDEEHALFPALAGHASPADLRRLGEQVRASRTWTGLAGSGRTALIDHRDAAEAGLRVLTDRLTGAGVPAGTAELLIALEWAILVGENDYTTATFQQITGRPRARWPSSFTSTARNSSDAPRPLPNPAQRLPAITGSTSHPSCNSLL